MDFKLWLSSQGFGDPVDNEGFWNTIRREDWTMRGLSHAKRYIGRIEDAEDIVQDVLLRIWKRANSPDAQIKNPSITFAAYFYAAIRKLCIDHIRRLDNTAMLESDLPAGYFLAAGKTVEFTSSLLEDDYSLAKLVGELDPYHGEVLAVFYGEKISHKKAAALIGITPQAFKSRLHRAKELLRKKFPSREDFIVKYSR